MLASIDSHRKLNLLFHYLRELPLVWFAVGLCIARLGIVICKAFSTNHRSIWLRRSALAASLLVLCVYLAIAFDSLSWFMVQQDEANILSISAATLRGLPMYHPPVSPDFSYSLMYGPFTFLIYSVALVAGGVSHFWIIRGAVVMAALLLCAALFFLLRKFVSAVTAITLLAFPLSILLQHPEISLSIRSDVWIFLLATLAIISSFFEVEFFAVLLTGILGGLIIGLKISAAPAILFPLLLLYRKFGLRAPAYALIATIATTFAPFAIPNISLHNYISWIGFTRSEGISVASASGNLLFAIFLISPCLIMELYMHRFGLAFKNRVPEFLIILLCLFLALLTSKNGSGVHYLWHIVPSIVVYMAFIANEMSAIPDEGRAIPLYSIAVACAFFACVNLPRAYAHIKIATMPPGIAIARQSIDKYLDRYQDNSSVQMGYGSVDGDDRSLIRYQLVFRGQPYRIEGNTGRFETSLLPFPVNVLHQMSSCKDDVWLVPHSQMPFDLWIFPGSLRTTFLHNYSVDTTDGVYDAWVCNRVKAH